METQEAVRPSGTEQRGDKSILFAVMGGFTASVLAFVLGPVAFTGGGILAAFLKGVVEGAPLGETPFLPTFIVMTLVYLAPFPFFIFGLRLGKYGAADGVHKARVGVILNWVLMVGYVGFLSVMTYLIFTLGVRG